jgi:hypothetical protein
MVHLAETTGETAEPTAGRFGEGPFLRRLLTYFGPALVVSVAYIDPDNYGTDIRGGASLVTDLKKRKQETSASPDSC